MPRLLAFVCLLGATTALAQAKDTEAAKRHYLAGKDALTKKDTDRAVREFVQAYDLSKDPTMFKQIGAAYESGGRNMEAAIYYRRYLNEASNAPDADEIRKRIEKLDAPPQAPAPPVPAQPAPTAPAPPEATSIPPTPSSFVEEESRGWRTAAWVSVGLGAVAVTTGIWRRLPPQEHARHAPLLASRQSAGAFRQVISVQLKPGMPTSTEGSVVAEFAAVYRAAPAAMSSTPIIAKNTPA